MFSHSRFMNNQRLLEHRSSSLAPLLALHFVLLHVLCVTNLFNRFSRVSCMNRGGCKFVVAVVSIQRQTCCLGNAAHECSLESALVHTQLV